MPFGISIFHDGISSLKGNPVTISREVVDPSDVEMLQDLVLAALHDLASTMGEAQQAAMGALGMIDVGNLFGGGAIDASSEESADPAED